jgi:hypothetical protein
MTLAENPFAKWIHFARVLDAYRIFPRLFFTVYIVLSLWSGVWFMGLAAPTAAQAAFMSTLVGAGAGWFGIYCGTGWKYKE